MMPDTPCPLERQVILTQGLFAARSAQEAMRFIEELRRNLADVEVMTEHGAFDAQPSLQALPNNTVPQLLTASLAAVDDRSALAVQFNGGADLPDDGQGITL